MAARKKVAKRWSVKSALLWVALVAVLVAASETVKSLAKQRFSPLDSVTMTM